jgi:trans-aconitate 2-methyltransferase
MAREARARLAGSGSRVEVVIADPLSPLPADPPFDAVVSVATFDRVPDHEALFANIAAALRPGGRLVAECGGAGDLERLEGALLGLGEPPEQRTRATPDATVCRLQAAGFRDCAAWLTPDPVRFERAEQLWTYLEHGLLRRRLEQMHFSQRWRFLRRVVERLDDLQVDFVRLSICAWKREGLSPGEDGCRW